MEMTDRWCFTGEQKMEEKRRYWHNGINLFYVNQSRTKFIEKQGFNFSSRYKFSVEYDKGTYILKGFECENPLPQNFF